MAYVLQTTYSNADFWMKNFEFLIYGTEKRLLDNTINIAWGCDLDVRQEAITRTNVDKLLWRHMTSLYMTLFGYNGVNVILQFTDWYSKLNTDAIHKIPSSLIWLTVTLSTGSKTLSWVAPHLFLKT